MNEIQSLNSGDLVSYNGSGFSTGGYTAPYNDWNNCFYYYYPTYWGREVVFEKSKVEQSFKILGKLMENNIITKELTVKEFMKMVNDIAEII